VSDESFGPAGPPRAPSHAVRYLVAAVAVGLIAAYALVAFVTRDQWSGTTERAGTTVTFTATTLDGSPPTPDELTSTRTVVSDRVAGLGSSDAAVALDGNILTVTVPGDGDRIRDIASEGGRLYMRPVIHVIPTESPKPTGPGGSSVPPPPAATSVAQRVADEKELRQSTDQSIQLLALQFQATRCSDEDVLAGEDDPNLPLVTCSEDGKEVYLLDKSILSGAQIEHATSWQDDQSGEYVVGVEFEVEAAEVWAGFTAANVGTRIAYTIDTKVASAPVIQEAIAGGRVTISSDFTAEQASDLAAALGGGWLPLRLTVESSEPAMVPGSTGLTPLRIGMAAGGLGVALAVIGAVVYLIASGRNAPPQRQ